LVVNAYPEPHLAEALTAAGVEILIAQTDRKAA
jgi:hypothetical protein